MKRGPRVGIGLLLLLFALVGTFGQLRPDNVGEAVGMYGFSLLLACAGLYFIFRRP